MKATKVEVGDHPWKPYVMPITDLVMFFAFTVLFFGGAMFDAWPLPTWFKIVGYVVFTVPVAFDIYQWFWKRRIRRWTMKNSEWLYDELHPRPTHDDI